MYLVIHSYGGALAASRQPLRGANMAGWKTLQLGSQKVVDFLRLLLSSHVVSQVTAILSLSFSICKMGTRMHVPWGECYH